MLQSRLASSSSGGGSSVGRVPDCDSGCRGFEPHPSPHKINWLRDILYFILRNKLVIAEYFTSKVTLFLSL